MEDKIRKRLGRLDMKYNIPDAVLLDLKRLAKKYGITKMILFGSRARGDFYERSDINIAVRGGKKAKFSLEVNEGIKTLLMFDVVDLDSNISEELLKEIERDGVVIYEKDR